MRSCAQTDTRSNKKVMRDRQRDREREVDAEKERARDLVQLQRFALGGSGLGAGGSAGSRGAGVGKGAGRHARVGRRHAGGGQLRPLNHRVASDGLPLLMYETSLS